MKISTIKLQEMVSKIFAGMGNNKLIPITQYVQLEVKDNIFTISATDATNYIYVKEAVETEDFYVVVDGNLFIQLINRMTCENVDLTLTDNCLIIKGNGEYKLDIQLDEEGQRVKFPEVLPENYAEKDSKSISKETIVKILNTNKAALATTLEIPCYTGYYFGKDVISTDTYKICALDMNVFDEPMLISATVMELLKVITEDNISVYKIDDVIIWETPTTIIFSRELQGIENYQIDAITNLVNSDMENSCEINKSQLLNMLDRLSLFVSPYDQNNVRLQFTKEGIICTSKQSNGSELIPYVDKGNEHKEFICLIDIVMLQSQIKAIPKDTFELFYGATNAIKICCEDVTQIISLNEE